MIMEAPYLKISINGNKIRLTFSNKFPASIRIVAVGRQDHYPFFIPIINLYDAIYQKLNSIKKEHSNPTLTLKMKKSNN